MTDEQGSNRDLGPAGGCPSATDRDWLADASFDLSDELIAHGREHGIDGVASSMRSVMDLARGEVMVTLIMARLDLERAEAELADAQDTLFRETEALQPIQADYNRLRDEDERLADTTGMSIDQKVDARQRRHALRDLIDEELEPEHKRQTAAVREAFNVVRALEQDSVPAYRAAVGRAERALADPPFDDLRELMQVAPQAWLQHCQTLGLTLLAADPALRNSTDGHVLVGGLMGLLKSAGIHDHIRNELVREARNRWGDSREWAMLRDLVNPPEPLFTPESPHRVTREEVDVQIRVDQQKATDQDGKQVQLGVDSRPWERPSDAYPVNRNMGPMADVPYNQHATHQQGF